MGLFRWIEQAWRDARFGARNLLRSPAFTAIAAGSLALGIGASTAMFSVIHAVILDPFPYRDVDSLMSIRVHEPDRRGGRTYYSVDQYLEFAERSTIFEGVSASTISNITWTGEGDPQRLRGNVCPMNMFEVMGVEPLIGRVTTTSDGVEGAEPVVVLGYKFWQRQFGGDSNVLGRKLRLNDKVRTVIGVMPRRFMFRGADVYIPVVFRRGEVVEGVRDVHVVGRLKAGVTPARAEADLKPIVEELKQRDPKEFPDKWRVDLLSFKETFPSDIKEALWILFGAVGLLLLIACVNVSNMLISRATVRQKEIAIRASLGANRNRLVRQLLAESLVLGLLGGAVGVLFAYGSLQGILAMVPRDTIPDESHVRINVPVLLFTLAVSMVVSLLFGLAPALHAAGCDIVGRLKESGRGSSGSVRQKLLRSGLVVCEVGLSLMLLVGASLMVRTLLAIQNVKLDARPDKVLTFSLPLSEEKYPDAARRNVVIRNMVDAISTIPGVAAVGVNTGLPPIYNWNLPVEVPGNAQQDSRRVLLNQTDAGFAQAMNSRLVVGRYFTRQEVDSVLHLAVVNESFVKRYLSDRDAIGRTVRMPRLREAPIKIADDAFQVIGVLKDSPNRLMTNETVPEIHIPYTVAGFADRIYVLAHGAPANLTNAVRMRVYSVDANQPVREPATVETLLGEYVYARPRFNLVLFGFFAVLGLTLALFGVYGVIASGVEQRRQEIGIRIALGASFKQVVGMVLRGGALLLGAGIVLGLLGSYASVRYLSGQLWQISKFDPISFAGVAALLFVAGIAASFWPARRAAGVDPAKALRSE